MFTSAERLQKRTPHNGIDRAAYIQLLADEFLETTNLEAKIQTSANLANFAYDPFNYRFLLASRVPEIYLDCLQASEGRLILHGIKGLCNSCSDPEIREVILANHCITSIIPLLWTKPAAIVVNALTTLMLIFAPDTKPLLTDPKIIAQANVLSKSSDPRIRTAAQLYLKDYACD